MHHYFWTQRLALGFAEVTAGPRFNLPTPDDRVSRLSVKPYAILTEVGLGEAQYFKSLVPGLESTPTVWDDLAIRTIFEFRQKYCSNARDRPFSSVLDGNYKL